MRHVALAVALALSLPAAACIHDDGAPRRTVPASRARATPGPAVARPRVAEQQAAAQRATQAQRAALRVALVARRRHHLDVLHAYRVAGVFPINTTVRGDGHFLIDPNGTFCAVANLIAQDGHRDVIVALSQRDNALLFGDVRDGEVMDWILASGFSQQEIARIQVPAPYVEGERPEIATPDPEILAANREVSDYLTKIEDVLRGANAEAQGIDAALAQLARRPELVAQILDQRGTAVASNGMRFAQPPPAN